jgi:succinate dehydrogenase/fumarate reductase flavoprotein subunit
MLEAERLYDTVAVASATTVAECILREDLLSAAFVLRAILTASRERLESRGCFIRTDFPAQDDRSWLKNSRLLWDSGRARFSVEYLPTELP